MTSEAAVANPLDLTGRVAFVTGGTKGLGRVIAETLLRAGAEVTVCARNEPDRPPQADGRTATFVRCDVNEPESVQTAVDAGARTHDGIDILVNNAGGAPPADSATASARFTSKILGLNLVGPLTVAQAVRPHMVQRGGGVIVNISSVSGRRANPMGVAYGAAKAGLENLTLTLAHEWGPDIRVLALTVGQILTDDNREFYGDQESIDRIAQVLAARRLGDPQEVADVVWFAVSDLARWVTGTSIEVHGGGEGPAYLLASTGDVTGGPHH